MKNIHDNPVEIIKKKLSYEQVDEIHDLLKNSTLSNRAIARKFNVEHTIINMINTGSSKKYRRENVQYPLRKF